MVYRLTVSYRGAAYAGWQRQLNAMTVQQRLEEALEQLLETPVRVTGAGRTDAGVHARGQVAHFELDREFPVRGLMHGGNRYLPEDIRILGASRMPEGFHARRSAVAKCYRYRLVRGDVLSPLDSLFAIRAPDGLDLDAMGASTELLVGEHDFTAFALAGGSHKQPVRRIRSATWEAQARKLEFEVVGNGFLRGMVRSLVGTLLEVGRGRIRIAEFERLLKGSVRSEAGPTAPPQGLTLEWVEYGPQWQPEPGACGVEDPGSIGSL